MSGRPDYSRRRTPADAEHSRRVAATVGAYRRLVLAHGPPRAIPVAMMLAELARCDCAACRGPRAAIGDGRHVYARPGAPLLARVLRVSVRTVERQIAELVGVPRAQARADGQWIRPWGHTAREGDAQAYRLVVPADIPASIRDAALRLPARAWDVIAPPDTDDGRTPLRARQICPTRPTNLAYPPDVDVGPMGWREDMDTRGRAREDAPAAQDEDAQPAEPVSADAVTQAPHEDGAATREASS
jgi:hypothetical protein